VIGIFELWQVYRAKLYDGISSLSLINFNKMALISDIYLVPIYLTQSYIKW